MSTENSEVTKNSGVILQVEGLYEDSYLPVRANDDDTGLDLYFHNVIKFYQNRGSNWEREVDGEDLEDYGKFENDVLHLTYLERVLIGTGIRVYCDDHDVQVRPRSGLALKKGITVINTPGTIDQSYRDELGVILVNLSRKEQTIKVGDRIAQLVTSPLVIPSVKEVDLDDTDRGGFGGSGE